MKNIFEVKEEGRHKLIKFLGIKFKFYKHFSKKQKNEFNKLDKEYSFVNKNYNKNHKQALMVYDYNVAGAYNPTTVNLGDYVQSLAAKQYLGDDLTYIDRDSIKFYKNENANMIMNGWYYLNNGNEVISDNINPLYVAYHLNNSHEVSQDAIESFKKHEPIGCRDIATRNFLLSKGVKAYFSSCLTTTLDIKYKNKEKERKGVIFCDYSVGGGSKRFLKVDKQINKILKKYNNEQIETTTHVCSFDFSHDERFKMAEDLLHKYAKAKLVVTTRIHCALPCLALGTPVILISKRYDRERYDGLFNFFNVIGYSKSGRFINNVLLEDGIVKNPDAFKPYAEKLKQKVYDWIN